MPCSTTSSATSGRSGRPRRRPSTPTCAAASGCPPTRSCSRGTTPTRSSRTRRRRSRTRCSTPIAGVDALAMARAYFAELGHDVDAILARSDLQPAVGQGPARVPDHDRARLRHPHALQPRADASLAGDAAARARPRDLRRQRRQVAAVAPAHALAHVHHRGGRDAARPAGARPRVPRAVRRARRGRRRARCEPRRLAARPARLRRLGAGDGALRASLYADPVQDLLATWWNKSSATSTCAGPTGIGRGDWAAKIHLTVAPVYYHNYLLGQMTASQLEATLARELGNAQPRRRSRRRRRAAARAVPAARRALRWDEHVRSATGSPLTTAAFAAELATHLAATGAAACACCRACSA